jgi:uncharacterized membrane protein
VSHSISDADSTTASSVLATVSGISAFGSSSYDVAFHAFLAFVVAMHSIVLSVDSVHLRNCSGLAREWTTAILAISASSPCYWLATHNVIF